MYLVLLYDNFWIDLSFNTSCNSGIIFDFVSFIIQRLACYSIGIFLFCYKLLITRTTIIIILLLSLYKFQSLVIPVYI